ncbi:peptidase propeptide and YPEB domain protein [Clostridium puniceum]|uniref:Peptidase propeptide and YPEB domain protein n=1 Tax=Clostridium puniceum TaxID=29367 RepID=A0A1S8TDM2_9CLOT|nr:YcdB/YcdC domain-containing protein [Clostridium puniceum]OOM75714.1 peptidase propeptide and YPEB domain protein [Clostridium puniceum]
MKKKGFLTRILMVCLFLFTICVPAFGAEEDSKGLEQAIVDAKKIIKVPDKYSEFTHYSSERETINGKVRVWNLSWSEKEGNHGVVSASVGENGFLYEYNKHDGDEDKKGLARITKDVAKATAEEFLSKAMIADASQMKNVDEDSNSYSNQEYNFAYQKFVNGIPVNFVTVNIGVNKYTGEVTSFSGNNLEGKGMEYPSVDKTIEAAVAEKAYIEKLGVNLKYYSYYDYKEKKMNVFAGYSTHDNMSQAIDAKTGEPVTLYSENKLYNDMKDSASGISAQSSLTRMNQELTKEETEAVKNVSGLISKEKAESILRGATDIITSDKKFKEASLNKNYINDGYAWNISFDNAYGEVDANTGEVLSLHCYDYDNLSNKTVSKADAKILAENFLKTIAPNKFAQTKYKEIENKVFKIAITEESNVLSLNFVRQVNGIEFTNNSLYVQVDTTKGKIVGYTNTWYNNITFPDVSQAMTKESAFNKFKELKTFGMQYVMIDKSKTGLVYNFKNLDENYIIDPISGKRLDYTGQVYKENKLPEYTDISGQWCEKIVKELLENGYYIEGDKFNPNMNISQINFLKYLYSPMQNNYTDDEFYDMLIQNGVVKKEEKAPNSLVSNQEAAKLIIRYLGYDQIAIHPEVFINPFKDNVDEKYKGYAAMAYALNLNKGDKSGNFNGSRSISNGEAAMIIYNLIKNIKVS